MANSLYGRITFLIFLTCFFLTSSLYAQESRHTFSQKLEWKSDADAFEYKVEIRNVKTREITEFKTEQTKIEFSFPSGDYEWRVTAYDFLGRESTKTNWVKFTIKKAIEPKAVRTKKEVAAYIERKFSVPLRTEKVDPKAKVELINTETNKSIDGKMEKGSVVFENAPEGEYKIKITNPGGLFAETEPIKLISQERLDEERRIEEERLAEERRREEERLAEERRREEERIAEEKRLEEERLAEEKRLEEERIAEEKRREEERLAEEKRIEEERLAEEQRQEEERLAKEARKNRPKKDILFMAGTYFPIGFPNIGNNPPTLTYYETFMDNSLNIGLDLKYEMLPIKPGNTKIGFNLQFNPLYLKFDNPYYSEERLFLPINLNLAFYMPIKKEKVLFGVQGGGGIFMLEYIQDYKYEENSEDMRPNIANLYINGMYDFGMVLRFIMKKNFVFDMNAEFANWCVDGYNIRNIILGVQIGLRL